MLLELLVQGAVTSVLFMLTVGAARGSRGGWAAGAGILVASGLLAGVRHGWLAGIVVPLGGFVVLVLLFVLGDVVRHRGSWALPWRLTLLLTYVGVVAYAALPWTSRTSGDVFVAAGLVVVGAALAVGVIAALAHHPRAAAVASAIVGALFVGLVGYLWFEWRALALALVGLAAAAALVVLVLALAMGAWGRR
ncbi:MAG TPA: hypothetical protein VM370_12410 [Candidatus Thermoplasmatota archaeon]|nr:hypothetical protein [Candidatus Thermoplasmatota archaeon]